MRIDLDDIRSTRGLDCIPIEWRLISVSMKLPSIPGCTIFYRMPDLMQSIYSYDRNNNIKTKYFRISKRLIRLPIEGKKSSSPIDFLQF